MRIWWILASAVLVALLPQSIQAQGLECAKHLQDAQTAIEKVTEDMKGMEQMPKDQLLQVHTLLDDAKMLLEGARHNCDKPQADYDLARGIAKADAARGYATAADILHFQYMKSMPAMKGGQGMPGMGKGPMPRIPK
jgi:hypothetical protein